MNRIRVRKRPSGYAQIDNRCLNDKRLSWKAKGLLAYLLSKPDNWQVWQSDLVNRATDGEHAVRTAIKELTEAGYVRRRQSKRVDGTFGAMIYTVYEEPLGGFPHPENPQADNPRADNHVHSNTDNSKPESSNTDSKKQQRADAREREPEQEPVEGEAALDEAFGPRETKQSNPFPSKSWHERSVTEPWRQWGTEYGTVCPRDGIRTDQIQQVGYMFEKEFHLRVPWENGKKLAFWVKQCAELWLASDGSIDLIRRSAKEHLRRGLSMPRPGSMASTMDDVIRKANTPAVAATIPGGRPDVNITQLRLQEEAAQLQAGGG